jgi:uncharacterized repeat protein (TIGR03803 family)
MTTAGGGYKVLRDFQPPEGKNPICGLVQGSDNNLYGTDPNGGSNGFGTIFKLSTTGKTFSVLYNFANPGQGYNPTGTFALHTNGTLYERTSVGGSQFPGNGVLYSFNNGLKPFASLVIITSGKVGAQIGLIGWGFCSATGVKFGSGTGIVNVVSDTYMTASPTSGATTDNVTALEPSGNLATPQVFAVLPSITGFDPPTDQSEHR